MFHWLEEIEPKMNTEASHDDHKQITIKKLELNTTLESISVLAQFFIAGSAMLSKNTVVQLPASNKKAYSTILNEIAPHFQNVKVVLKDNE